MNYFDYILFILYIHFIYWFSMCLFLFLFLFIYLFIYIPFFFILFHIYIHPLDPFRRRECEPTIMWAFGAQEEEVNWLLIIVFCLLVVELFDCLFLCSCIDLDFYLFSSLGLDWLHLLVLYFYISVLVLFIS